MSCGIGCRCLSHQVLLWLWRRLAVAAPIQPLAWKLPYAEGAALKIHIYIYIKFLHHVFVFVPTFTLIINPIFKYITCLPSGPYLHLHPCLVRLISLFAILHPHWPLYIPEPSLLLCVSLPRFNFFVVFINN